MDSIASNKGGQKLCLDGYLYTKKSTKPKVIQWRYSQKDLPLCKASLYTNLDVSVLL